MSQINLSSLEYMNLENSILIILESGVTKEDLRSAIEFIMTKVV